MYICITPNRLSGPHDVSAAYDTVATGFHLKEYTTGDLTRLLRDAGFTSVQTFYSRGRGYLQLPVLPLIALESTLGLTPGTARRLLRRHSLIPRVLNLAAVRLIAAKPT